MAEDPQERSYTARDFFNDYSLLFTIVSSGGVLFTGVLAVIGWLPSYAALLLGGLCIGALLVSTIGFLSVSNRTPPRTLGDLRVLPATHSGTPPIVNDANRYHSLQEIQAEYELKPLEPYFVDDGSEKLFSAHYDENNVIMRGAGSQQFDVLTRSFGNRHWRRKVRSVSRVSFSITFLCYDLETKRNPQRVIIDRGAWLNQDALELDFPAECPTRKAIIATVESGNRVCAVRRDSDSYRSILPLPELLTGGVYHVFITLRVDSQKAKSFEYIFEILREPKFDLRMTEAKLWKTSHLRKYYDEGMSFITRLLDIQKDGKEQFPWKPTEPPITPRLALSFGSLRSVSDPDSDNFKKYLEFVKTEEKKLIPELEEWEARILGFLDQYFVSDIKDQFAKCIPSFVDGLNETRKPPFYGISPRRPDDQSRAPRESATWAFSDAISSRLRKLEQIIDGL